MIDRKTAEQARDHILEAIRHINSSVRLIDGQFPNATLKSMLRTAGLAIGTLDTEYLAHIFKLYPDLDDLSESDSRSPAPDEG